MSNVKHTLGTAVVIGGGPAGLMAAEQLAVAGVSVQLFDAMPTVGRKFLLAGVGGMNISHSEAPELFNARFGERQDELRTALDGFGAQQLRDWIEALGIETFVGTSGRVFPKQMKAAPLLRAWLHRLRESGVQIHTRHKWLGWNGADSQSGNPSGQLLFATPFGTKQVEADVLVLALGGGSWTRLGSDGAWVPWLRARGAAVADLVPSNCGFECVWSDYFKTKFSGEPVKGVSASVHVVNGRGEARRGEFVVTEYGLEGSLIYAHSALLRTLIGQQGHAQLNLDLLPDRTLAQVLSAVSKPRGTNTLGNHLRKTLKLTGVKAAMLREVLSSDDVSDVQLLARTIKALPLRLMATRPLDEAISSAGGVEFQDLDSQLMLSRLPGVFCAGEMLDWEAPTGGYLLTACFATGRLAGQGAARWLTTRSVDF